MGWRCGRRLLSERDRRGWRCFASALLGATDRGESQCVFGDFCVPSPSDQTVGVCMQLTEASSQNKKNHPCTDAADLVWVDVIERGLRRVRAAVSHSDGQRLSRRKVSPAGASPAWARAACH